MALAEQISTSPAPAPTRRRRSFKPRYPAWLAGPSLIYYVIFFLGPMAILAAFSVSKEVGFNQISFGFDTSQYSLITNSLYLTIFERTLLMAGVGSILTMIVGYPIAYWMARYLRTYKMLALLLIVVAVLDLVPDPHLRAQDHP